MALYTISPFIGPVVGPLISGYILHLTLSLLFSLTIHIRFINQVRLTYVDLLKRWAC